MKKKYRVKHQHDFDKIIKNKNQRKNDIFIIYSQENNLEYARFGISVGKKLGNAVYRNRKKRQIRSIIDNLEKNYLRKKGKHLEYQSLNKKLKSLIIEGKDKK